MKVFLLLACFSLCTVNAATAEVSVTRAQDGWEMSNGHISLNLIRAAGTVQLKSLRREGGEEWAVAGTSVVTMPDKQKSSCHYVDDSITDLDKGGKELTLHFGADSGEQMSLMLRLYPEGAVVQLVMKVENRGQQTLQLNPRVDPLFFTVRSPAGGLKTYSSTPTQHGFQPVGSSAQSHEFSDWLVLENGTSGESMLVGGEPGLGILGWKANVQPVSGGISVRAGTSLHKDKKSGPALVFEVAPGETVESPTTFFAIAKGDTDDAGNEAFRFLKRYVFMAQLPDAPWVTYCIWLTQANSEETLLSELKLAKRVGFDVFYHDATWYRDASIVPGMNDWTKGLGNYEENKEKFPHGIKAFTDAVHAAGLKTGIWVDPGNVDATLVESGQIPRDWVAKVDGKELSAIHPSLAPTRQLCLGDPKVVAWVEQQLSEIIEKWHLDWIKWDPSATQNYECTRTDHGHGATDGAYAAYQGREEILRFLMKRFPNLSGFECDPSLQYARTNPGPQTLLPGGYSNDFITGPMVSPNVWGSLAAAGKGDAGREYLTERWYSASMLDYYFRKHFTKGVTFGNINGMTSQMLSQAPAGFIEAFERNLMYFKQYRHLLLDDVYHPKLSSAGWSSIQYVSDGADESVVFIFRDKSEAADTKVRLKGLDGNAKYRLTSLNDRPGREKVMTGQALMNGIASHLPDAWLANGDGVDTKEFADQQRYGSDVLMLSRIP